MEFMLISILGSSANLLSHRAGGARARKNKIAAKKFASLSEGAAEGGCGGNSAAPERSAERSEAVRLEVSIGIFTEKGSDFVQGMEPDWMIRVLRLGASPLGGQIGENFPRLFGFKANRLRAQNVVRRAKRGVNGNLPPILFLPSSAESKAIIFNCPKAI